MVVRGWEKLEDKSSSAFTLKWVELKQHIDYKNFREGQWRPQQALILLGQNYIG